jgi:hypothetical protein
MMYALGASSDLDARPGPRTGVGGAGGAGAAANWAVAAAVLVFVGSFMPFVGTALHALRGVDPTAKNASALFAVLLGALAMGMRQPASRAASAASMLGAAVLGAMVYGGFAYAGAQGFEMGSATGGPTHVEFSPGAGLIACLVGCLVAMPAAIGVLRSGTEAGPQVTPVTPVRAGG